ncbi:hypothetical protein D5272_15570 [bacterium D16-76]|nr:hypothetical protein [bacterium D16-76]
MPCIGLLRAQEHGHQPLVFENHKQDGRYTGPMPVSPTICSGAGFGELRGGPLRAVCRAGYAHEHYRGYAGYRQGYALPAAG